MDDDFENERNHYFLNDQRKNERNGSFTNDELTKYKKNFNNSRVPLEIKRSVI